MIDFFFCLFQLWRQNVNFVKFDPKVNLVSFFCQIRPRVSKTTKTTGFSVTYFPSVGQWSLKGLMGQGSLKGVHGSVELEGLMGQWGLKSSWVSGA